MVSLLLAIIYLVFISLGLPDGLLGAVWPTVSPIFGVPISYMGIVSAIICAGTVTSSLLSDRLTRKLGVGVITALSVATTAIALFGLANSNTLWVVCLWAVPYGIGAGGVDAALNNYVALHYSSTHMSWLHCMWGVGASIGPYIMGYALTNGSGWQGGYMYVFYVQLALTVVIMLSLPLWNKVRSNTVTDIDTAINDNNTQPLSMGQILRIRGTRQLFVAFFCYCAIESTLGMYASSYLVKHRALDKATAAQWASWYYIGITAGRAVCGLIALRMKDISLIRIGQATLVLGVALILLPMSPYVAMVGLILAGVGCAPIYPCIIHSTPANFGASNSQAIIGVQMASAYLGSLLMPPLFGLIARYIDISLYPVYILLLAVTMAIATQLVQRATKDNNNI